MSEYLVVVSFTDLQDNDFQYRVGDVYPHPNYNPTKERIEELSTNKNRRGIPMIKAVKSEPQVVGDAPEKMKELQAEEIVEKPKRGRKKKNAD